MNVKALTPLITGRSHTKSKESFKRSFGEGWYYYSKENENDLIDSFKEGCLLVQISVSLEIYLCFIQYGVPFMSLVP